MFTITDTILNQNCQGVSRREFLRVGALGTGSLALPHLLSLQAKAAEVGTSLKKKSVVFLFLQGGPSHIEFFDPKMSAPVEFRSITGEIKTKTPGVTFGGTFPQLAKITDKFSILRSYGSKNSGHTYQEVASGGNSLKSTMGAIYARVAGNNHPETGMPTNVLIKPEAIDANLKLGSNFETGALPTLTSPGVLGSSFNAFDPQGGGELKQNMQMKLSQERMDSRRELLRYLDQMKRSADASGLVEGMDKYQQQAFEVITRGIASAFDLSQEDPKTIARYDTSHLFSNREVQKWGDMRRSSNLLGKQMLLARRLCEAGCGFVTVSDCGWDMHSNGNSPKGLGGMNWLGSQVDHAVAAFIQDLEERGMSDDVLLVVTGEMGRTPRINKNGGRDHYGELTPLLFSGGGLKMGQVIGDSDKNAERPATFPYTPKHMLGTVMNTLFDIGILRLDNSVPTDIIDLANAAEPISELI